MSSRHSHSDPVVRAASSSIDFERFTSAFEEALQAVGEYERVLIWEAFQGVARTDGHEEFLHDGVFYIQNRLRELLPELRDTSSTSWRFTDARVVEHMRDVLKRSLGLPTNLGEDVVQIEWCERHKRWVEQLKAKECPMCPCALVPAPNHLFGNDFHRPRIYCSNACRQAAYRRRLRKREERRPAIESSSSNGGTERGKFEMCTLQDVGAFFEPCPRLLVLEVGGLRMVQLVEVRSDL